MKSFFLGIVSLALLLSVFVFPATSNAYTGGLLNGKVLNISTGLVDWRTPSFTIGSNTTLLTDDNESTGMNFSATCTEGTFAWYTFNGPTTISSYREKGPNPAYLYYYDAGGKSLGYTKTDITTGIQTNITSVNNVKTIAIEIASCSSGFLYEVDVYGTTTVNAPSSPTNLIATGMDKQVSLNWNNVSGASSYNIKRSLSSGGPYEIIASNVTDTSYLDLNVINGTKYYYVVTANNSGGESANSNEVNATPKALTRTILKITTTNGVEQEFDLSKSEFESYVTWFDAKAAGTGSAKYIFDNPQKKGSFSTRKISVAFDKIMKYDYDEYAVDGSIPPAESTQPITSGVNLTLTLENGDSEEFVVTTDEYNAFSAWYDGQSNGTGLVRYTFTNPHAKGPYLNRSNVVIFDKISEIDADSFVVEE
ncbi:hypothetical protein [Paenibacillus ferrarius]|uniref:hypothetical protein n=1 Tax=Paenibacillus ferrarius TaxID=1469647 RepID=UPI003D2CC419